MPGSDTWVVMPTYNEADNLAIVVDAILRHVPDATVLVVDDASPDGTGEIADVLAAGDPRVRVRHRPRKRGLGRAYVDGFGVALAAGATRVVQIDADLSHDPVHLPQLLGLLRESQDGPGADLVIGSRYIPGGGVDGWGVWRRVLSWAASTFARTVLRLTPHDLTGAYKAWRAETLRAIPWRRIHSGGYVFMIETTFLASRAGAQVAEVPIVFRDRTRGRSKMSRRIIAEALIVVLRLRAEELVARARTRIGGGRA